MPGACKCLCNKVHEVQARGTNQHADILAGRERHRNALAPTPAPAPTPIVYGAGVPLGN